MCLYYYSEQLHLIDSSIVYLLFIIMCLLVSLLQSVTVVIRVE